MRWSSPGKPITRLQPVQPIDFFLTVAAPSYNTKYENYEHGDFARHARGGGADVQRGVIVVLMLVLALTAASCGGLRPWRAPAEPAEPLPEPPVRLVTTVYALAEFSRAVGGDRVAVELLVPAGGHAHDYEPTPRDVERILRADVFVYNGAAFEPWVDQVVELIGAGPPHAVDASGGIELHRAGDPGTAGGSERGTDPHVWLDPQRAARQVAAITEALVQVDPAGEGLYRANAGTFHGRLAALDGQGREALAGCRLRHFIVDHGAFGYLAGRYGLVQVAVTGVAADHEPPPRRLAELAAFMREQGIAVVYREPGTISGALEALAAETGAAILTLHPLETPGAGEEARAGTYLTIMEENFEALRQGLDCPAREG